MPDTPAPAPKCRIMERAFAVASFRYNRWAADLDETQTIEDTHVPQFWAGVVDKVMGHDKTNPNGIGDIIEIRQRSTGLFVECLVIAIGPGFMRIKPLRAYVPEEVSEPEESPLTTRWNVGRRCHEVVRKSDKQVMASNFQTKDVAVAWINDHLKAMAA